MPPIKLGRKLGSVGEQPNPITKEAIRTVSTSIGWVESKYEVSLKDSEELKMVEGRVKGVLGVNECFPDDKGELTEGHVYSLTHLPTKLRMIALRTEEDCIRVGDYLLQHHKKCFYSTSEKETRLSIPESIKAWIFACRKVKCWIDPVEFLKELKSS